MRHDGSSIYAQLRDDIATGRLGTDTIRETDVAARFGVSRTPARDALNRLVSEHTLVRTRQGLRLRVPDPEEIIQVYDLRILLEAEASAQAAQARTLADLTRLSALVARDRTLTDPDQPTMIATNLEFHAAVAAAAHNPVLTELLGGLTARLVHLPRSTLTVDGRWRSSLDEHAEIVAAIERRDDASARGLAAAHMTTAKDLRLALLKEAVTTISVADAPRPPR